MSGDYQRCQLKPFSLRRRHPDRPVSVSVAIISHPGPPCTPSRAVQKPPARFKPWGGRQPNEIGERFKTVVGPEKGDQVPHSSIEAMKIRPCSGCPPSGRGS